MAISQALQDIYAANPTGAYYFEVVEIEHSALSAPLVMTNASVEANVRVNVNAARAIPVPFTVVLPAKDTTGTQSFNLVISNREQEILHNFEQMAVRPEEAAIMRYNVFIRGVVSPSGVHQPQYNPAPRYDITAFNVDENSITAIATKVNLHNKRWPRVTYTPSLFPGLDR